MIERTLEIVEGPAVGTALPLTGVIVIGRDPDADLVLEDSQVSRRHARVTPTPYGAIVEDLGSTNGTFVDSMSVQGPVRLEDGGELVIGVTVLLLRAGGRATAVATSAVREIPPALAAPARRPTFTDPVTSGVVATSNIPELDRLRDTHVRSKARVAPLAVFVLAALVVVIYLGMTST